MEKKRPSVRSPERGTEVRIFKLVYRGTGAQPDQLPNLTEDRKGELAKLRDLFETVPRQELGTSHDGTTPSCSCAIL